MSRGCSTSDSSGLQNADGLDCGGRDNVLPVERKLLVEDGCRIGTGRFDPWSRRPNCLDPGTDKTEPKVGVVAR